MSLEIRAHFQPHDFHIPVMGLGFTVDTPVKVARFGISSVISLMEDILIENIRKVYCEKNGIEYTPISDDELDHRAMRISSYLNLVDRLVKEQMVEIKKESFEPSNDIVKYFEMLPEDSEIKLKYHEMLKTNNPDDKKNRQDELRKYITPGSIDVNIMTKLDRINYGPDGEELPSEFSDASAAMRGFAQSDLNSSVVFSAGLNPRLFALCTTFDDFYPDQNGNIKKKIILKVSDFRSAMIQGKFFAKKGLWVSEFRIESGLNCGGHAFATEGLLMGPILEEFKSKKEELTDELFEICSNALTSFGKIGLKEKPVIKITVQGGIGTAKENKFLLEYYNLDSTGWGSPFLLVPEATNVDDDTLQRLIKGKKEDYFLSNASPLGVPFNNFRLSSSEEQRLERLKKNRPGSPCYKKFLAFDNEFEKKTPICTASREYQHLKIKQVKEQISDPLELENEINRITEKDCLCEGLGASALMVNGADLSHNLNAVTICPGPNLAYFTGVFTLKEMIDQIYGRSNILNKLNRDHMFINELYIYIEYLKKEYETQKKAITQKMIARYDTFKQNLLNGIDYYTNLTPALKMYEGNSVTQFAGSLAIAREMLHSMEFKIPCLQH